FDLDPVRPQLSARGQVGRIRAVLDWLGLDHDPRRRPTGAARELIAYIGGDVAIGFGDRTIGLGRNHGKTGIRFLPDGHVQGHLAEERYAEPLRLLARAAMA